MDELPHRYLLQEIPYTLEVSLFSGSHIFLVVYSLFIADILYFSNNWTTLIWPFQGRLAHSQAACHMETGVVRCRRSRSTAPPSSRKMPSHIQVSVKARCLYQTSQWSNYWPKILGDFYRGGNMGWVSFGLKDMEAIIDDVDMTSWELFWNWNKDQMWRAGP